MDPQACLQALLENLVSLKYAQEAGPGTQSNPVIVEDHQDDVIEGLENLKEWIEKAGYAPDPRKVLGSL